MTKFDHLQINGSHRGINTFPQTDQLADQATDVQIKFWSRNKFKPNS